MGVCDVYLVCLGLVAVCELLANGFRIAYMELGRASCGSLRGGRGAGVARGIYSWAELNIDKEKVRESERK